MKRKLQVKLKEGGMLLKAEAPEAAHTVQAYAKTFLRSVPLACASRNTGSTPRLFIVRSTFVETLSVTQRSSSGI